jgi:hypothetical protein
VNYEYQISRTEVAEAEWYEFVVAYSPYVDPDFENRPRFTGNVIRRTSSGTYTPPVGAEPHGRDHMAFRRALRQPAAQRQAAGAGGVHGRGGQHEHLRRQP